MLVHILCGFTKDEASCFKDITYIRVLGFNKKGQKYLGSIKKGINLPIITTFSKDNAMLQLEARVTAVYASVLDENEKNKLIYDEYATKVIIKQ